MAIDASGQLLLFFSACSGLKADKSVEIDFVLTYWTSLDSILGRTFAVGLGLDNEALGKTSDTDESGFQIEVLFDSNVQMIGGAISQSYGRGKDMPINGEVNLDQCFTYELWRLDLRRIVTTILTKLFGKDSIGNFFRLLSYLHEHFSPI